MSKSSRHLLKVQGVKLFPGRIQGHRTDIDEYITADYAFILQRAREVRTEGPDSKQIVATVAEELGGIAGVGGGCRREVTSKHCLSVKIASSPG